jgi:hypothetical protein
VRDAVHIAGQFERELVDLAPEPILAGLVRLPEWVSGDARVPGGVRARRVVAAADVRAERAPTQVDPDATILEALDTPGTARGLRPDRI